MRSCRTNTGALGKKETTTVGLGFGGMNERKKNYPVEDFRESIPSV